uniref:Uncharacterized protein n=1 Tax=Ditylenchus dipsaci TaxID=166011 RepID=A0A915DJ84_9BILA
MKHSYLAVLLRSQAEELLNKYKLNVRDIYKIVTDSGRNILCAFKDILLVESLSAEDDEEDKSESAITARGRRIS